MKIKNSTKTNNMSGGHFEYNQYGIRDIWEEIQNILDKQGRRLPEDELYGSKDYYSEYPEEELYPTYSPEVQGVFIDAINLLKRAEIYAQRIDWFLSGDDGEESFLKRLKEELDELNNK